MNTSILCSPSKALKSFSDSKKPSSDLINPYLFQKTLLRLYSPLRRDIAVGGRSSQVFRPFVVSPTGFPPMRLSQSANRNNMYAPIYVPSPSSDAISISHPKRYHYRNPFYRIFPFISHFSAFVVNSRLSQKSMFYG